MYVPVQETAEAAADTLQHGAHEGGSPFAALLHHVQDAHELETPFGAIHLPQFAPFTIGGITIDMSITKHVVFLWIAALVLCIVGILVARSYSRKDVPSGFGNAFEVLVLFIRDEVVIPNMGPKGLVYMPYLLTTFFFILLMNLLGLIPYGASATGNVNVTAGLAVIAFVMIQAASIRAQGFGHYLAHLTGGVPWALWPIMIPIEILGLFTKPFALCIRLFANMIGGHLVLLSLIGLIFIFKALVVVVAPVAVGFVVALNFLELFVAVLQAYIFTMLTSLFMGLGMPAEAHGESGHGH
jgi:F-type H+-transporting ATPase subunit a